MAKTQHETQRPLFANNTDVSADFLYVHSLMFFKICGLEHLK